MDENAATSQNQNQPIQNTPQRGVTPIPQTPLQQGSPVSPAQPIFQAPAGTNVGGSSDIFTSSPHVPVTSQQAASPASAQVAQPDSQPLPQAQNPQVVAPQAENSPKITLNDLYGPSTPEERESVSGQQPSSQDSVAPQPPVEMPVSVSQSPPVVQEVPQSFQSTPQPVDVMPGAQQKDIPQENNNGSGDLPPDQPPHGGFHFSSVFKFLIGATVLVVIGALLVSFLSSLFHQSSNGKVTLTYWGLWEDSAVMQGVINDFERTHPNITVTYTKQDPNKYTDRLLTRIQNGTGPDIFRYHNSWVTPLQSILLPLPQNVLNSATLQKDYPPVVSQDLVKNGAILGLPLEVDTLSLFVNKDIFDHAGASVPTTWDQFVTVAKALTVKDPSGKIKTAGAAMGTFDNIDHAPDIVSLLLLQNGANLQKLSGSQNTVDALTFYTSFANSDNNVWDSSLDNSTLAFARGQLAMFFGYSWDVLAIKAVAPNLHFAVYPVPHLPGRDMTIASYWVEGISNRSKHQKEAAEFLAYLAQKDTQTKLYTEEAKSREFGELYAPLDLAATLKSNPLLASFVTQSGKAVSTFFVGDTQYDEFNGSLNRYLGNAVASVLGNTSIDTAVTTLAQGVAQVFNQYAQPTP